MEHRIRWVVIAAASVVVASCGKRKAESGPPAKAATPPPSAPAVAPPPSPAPPTTPPPVAADPFAQGFCEYQVDGGPPNKGGGGMNNVMSTHWMTADQPGRSLASPLIINCGKGQQLSLSPTAETTDAALPMKAGTFVIATSGKPGQFTALGADFMGGDGELVISAWDTSHVAGSFHLTTAGAHKTVVGTFDLRCPFAGNGVCAP